VAAKQPAAAREQNAQWLATVKIVLSARWPAKKRPVATAGGSQPRKKRPVAGHSRNCLKKVV